MGGDGGSGGTGGLVTVTQQGSITTSGDHSPGILAQSIGGGGGKGGVAVAGSETNTLKSIAATLYINSNASLGMSGSGGTGNDGGAVNVMLNPGTIVTGLAGQGSAGAGFLSHGVVAQSVGGGGGQGADGTTNPGGALYLGGAFGGGGGKAANGGAVTINQTTSGVSSITTYGNSAIGLFAQSIGGGGGIAGVGSSLVAGTGAFNGTVSLSLGGRANGTTGTGGTVLVNFPGTTIRTSGYSSFGILAQSVGGGGGYASVSGGATVDLTALGGTGSVGNGGAVTANLSSAGGIVTTGIGAHGIVAQSVGGGGGIAIQAPVTNVAPSIQFTAPSGVSSTGSGVGGAVSVTSHAPISVSGAGAMAILAQSVASGGGLAVLPSGAVFAGSTQANPTGVGAGTVSVVTQGTITASGENGVAIFAQSAPDNVGNRSGVVTVLVQGGNTRGIVTGGSGAQGAGIWVLGGEEGNLITVDTGVTVSAASGLAINYYGNWGVDVTNRGTISGNSTLGGGTLTNAGTQVVAGPAYAGSTFFGRTVVDGNFVQTATGRIVTTADFAGGRAGRLVITRNATLAGGIQLAPTTLLPNIALPVVEVNGTVSGGLSGIPSTLFGYQVTRSANLFHIQASSADFTPVGFVLSASQAQVASHLQSAWDRGGHPALAPLFALLGAAADRDQATYAAQLRQLSADSTVAPGARAAAGTQAFANNAMSCPQFEGTTAMLVEGQCAWLRVTGRVTSQDSGNGVGRYGYNTMTWQIGGQQEFAPGWFIGGSLAYEATKLTSDDRVTSGRGQGGYGAVVVKHQTGPWLFTGAVVGGAGQFNASRVISLPGYGSVAKGSPDSASVGALARVSYTMGRETFYLRPHLTLGVVHARGGAYQESGAGALNLSVDSASRTALVATPMLEVGGRVSLGGDMVLRPYIGVGATLQTANTWNQTARLVSAPAGASGFTTSIPIDPVAARVTAGLQLYTGGAVDLRLQYDGEYSGTTSSSAGSLVATLRF